jgi:hypothetical protein
MSDSPPRIPEEEAPDEPPPFLGTWRRVYAAVLLYLAALIGVFYWFGVAFTP